MSGIDRVMALRADIIQRSDSLRQLQSAKTVDPQGLANMFDQALKTVTEQQQSAARLAASFERGESNDLATVMIERQKSSLAFQTVVQTRNKLLGAYRDIMNMPV